MSASLVGSEMCIRDRSGAALQAAPQAAMHAVSQAAARAASRTQAAPPVSYTHLTLPTICSV
eukprot:9043323-Alexandrium_andersonii.AAC.1